MGSISYVNGETMEQKKIITVICMLCLVVFMTLSFLQIKVDNAQSNCKLHYQEGNTTYDMVGKQYC